MSSEALLDFLSFKAAIKTSSATTELLASLSLSTLSKRDFSRNDDDVFVVVVVVVVVSKLSQLSHDMT